MGTIEEVTFNGQVKLCNGNVTTHMPEDLDLKTIPQTDNTNFKKKSAESDVVESGPVLIRINGVYAGLDADADWDPYELSEQQAQWSEVTSSGKAFQICRAFTKIVVLLFLLYVFVCSLDFLSSAFRLLGGKKAGEVFQNSSLLKNPIVGLMIGVLATVLVQSSSTSTSIIVTMVGSGIIQVRNAIPIIMGANIGTSVTSTIVSFTQANVRDEFRRAFAAATVHDMFNWLSVIVLLPIEIATGYLEKLTNAIMDSQDWEQHENLDRDMLKKLTKPFTSSIIQLDKNLIEAIATNQNVSQDLSFIKKCYDNDTNEPVFCGFLMERINWSDTMIGVLLLAIALTILCTCLVLMVKVLHSMLQGQIAGVINRMMNTEPPFPYSVLVGYTSMLVGCGMTILVQSSSIFTSALTPLVGVGIIPLERMYPMVLGSNIGTTTTSILAAFAASSNKLRDTLQIAFCHLFFNFSGILLFYPLPFTRLPIPLAKILGNTTAKYRWFALLYLIVMFFMLPLFIFSLSVAGHIVLLSVGIPLLVTFFAVIIINVFQCKCPNVLPDNLRTWKWLPEWMHSLDPLDRQISRIIRLCKCCNCLESQTRHDGRALGMSSDHSQLNIIESASRSTDNIAAGLENKAFVWNSSVKSKSGSTMV